MNLFAFISVFLGVFAWVMVMAFMDGLQDQSRRQMLNENPHLLWEGAIREDLVAKKAQVEALLGSQARSVEFSLQTEGLLERPVSKANNRDIEAVVMQGDLGVKPGKMHVGEELAMGMGLAGGELLELRSIWRLEGSSLGLSVSEVFSSQVYEIDKRVVRVNQRDLEKWLGFQSAVSRVAIQLKNPLQVDQYKNAVSKALGVPVKTWREVDESYWYSLKLERLAMGISMFFVIALASLAVNMALSARVAERGREIALLRALGLSKNQVFRLYLLEGVFIGGASIALGLIAAPVVATLVSKNFRLPDIYYRTELPLYWDVTAISLLSFFSLLLCIWASWRPAKRAMETAVASGLRF